jgi:hypothetical protein
VKVPLVVPVCVVVPLVATEPDQGLPSAPPPLAVQLVAPCEDHVKVKLSPTVTLEALVVSVLVSACTVSSACVDVGATTLESILSHVSPKVNFPTSAAPPGV